MNKSQLAADKILVPGGRSLIVVPVTYIVVFDGKNTHHHLDLTMGRVVIDMVITFARAKHLALVPIKVNEQPKEISSITVQLCHLSLPGCLVMLDACDGEKHPADQITETGTD